MNSPANDFGLAQSIDAEAVGQPGNRRFRLVAIAAGRTASIWMEKQQLASIGEWFDEVRERLERENPDSSPGIEPEPIPLNFDIDFRAVQIGLGLDEDGRLFTLHAFDGEAAGDDPTFRVQVNHGQARVLARKIQQVVSSGRPICPLCQAPMDPAGHICPRSNGHHAQARI